jgi:HlyD family secretion protein
VKRIIVWIAGIGILAAAAAAGVNRFHASGGAAAEAKYRTAKVRKGDVKQTVNSTGTVQPVRSVQVGSFVSGPVQEVLVDYNDKVTEGQPMARIDPRLYEAAVRHEKAALLRAKSDKFRIEALLFQAERNEKRALDLDEKKAISQTDMDLYTAERKSLEAQLKVAGASIEECEANLETAETNLKFTSIVSPADGIVTDRKIDPGQTVAAQFQTPTLFVVAPDLEKHVYVYASVDEADIGLIREAKETNQSVSFTVDAYPNDAFEGSIYQIRLNPTTVSNVVTYTVVVKSANPDLKLLPGMTANLTFQIKQRLGVPTLPLSALRFRPKPEQVILRDRPILEGLEADVQPESRDAARKQAEASGETKPADRTRGKKYVWIADGDLLSAVPVEFGLSDKSSTEVISDTLKEGQEIVVGAMK